MPVLVVPAAGAGLSAAPHHHQSPGLLAVAVCACARRHAAGAGLVAALHRYQARGVRPLLDLGLLSGATGAGSCRPRRRRGVDSRPHSPPGGWLAPATGARAACSRCRCRSWSSTTPTRVWLPLPIVTGRVTCVRLQRWGCLPQLPVPALVVPAADAGLIPISLHRQARGVRPPQARGLLVVAAGPSSGRPRRLMSARDMFDLDGPLRDARLPPLNRGNASRSTRGGNYYGWVNGLGPGRAKGSTLKVRERVRDVLTVVLYTELNRNLNNQFMDGGIAARALLGLRPLRNSLKSVTDKALRQRASFTGRSGSFGVLLHMGTSRSRLDKHRLPSYVIEVVRGATGRLQVSCSGPEKCLDECGCAFWADMAAALEAVRLATALSMGEVFSVLEASVKHNALTIGTAVPYGKSLSVVRSGSGSWPFAVVRKTVAGRWICMACPVSDGECGHRAAAANSADTFQDADEDDDGASQYKFPDDGLDEQDEMADLENMGVSRFRLVHISRLPRDVVPPNSAQQANTSLLLSASTGMVVEYPAPETCPFFSCGPAAGSQATSHDCRVEFADGSIDAKVFSWRCLRCRYRVMVDGCKEGLVFSSPFSAYSKAFMFELAVSLTRNGSSLRSSSDLRSGLSELSAPSRY